MNRAIRCRWLRPSVPSTAGRCAAPTRPMRRCATRCSVFRRWRPSRRPGQCRFAARRLQRRPAPHRRARLSAHLRPRRRWATCPSRRMAMPMRWRSRWTSTASPMLVRSRHLPVPLRWRMARLVPRHAGAQHAVPGRRRPKPHGGSLQLDVEGRSPAGPRRPGHCWRWRRLARRLPAGRFGVRHERSVCGADDGYLLTDRLSGRRAGASGRGRVPGRPGIRGRARRTWPSCCTTPTAAPSHASSSSRRAS